MSEWKFAKIKDARLFIEDHGYLTWFLYLEYAEPGDKIGGSGQGFGGYGIGHCSRPAEDNGGYASWSILKIMEAVGVQDWADIKGKSVWVKGGHTHIEAIRGLDTGKEFAPGEWDTIRAERAVERA